jgi:hypothetical protein
MSKKLFYLTAVVFFTCTQPSVDELHEAIEQNSIEKVEYFLKKGIIPDDHAIVLALNNDKMLVLLIEKGANVNTILDSNAMSLLEWAIKNRKLQLVELLIQQGADVSYINKKTKKSMIFDAIDLLPESYLSLFFLKDPNLLEEKNRWNLTCYATMIGKHKFNALMDLKKNPAAFNILLSKKNLMLILTNAFAKSERDERYEKFADFLILNGYNLNNGFPYLQDAIWNTNYAAFKWLLDNGCSPVNPNLDKGQFYGYATPMETLIMRKNSGVKNISGDELEEENYDQLEQEREILSDMEQLLVGFIDKVEVSTNSNP